jgi:intein/homing endonuclease
MELVSQLSDLQDFTFTDRYAQWKPDASRRETWAEACERMRSAHLQKFAGLNVDDEINEAINGQIDQIALGSQRMLQFAGPAIFKHNCRVYNCAALYLDKPFSLAQYWYALLAGTGMGVSVQTHHIKHMPKLLEEVSEEKVVHSIQDSIEGWADSILVMLASQFGTVVKPEFERYKGKQVVFDYSMIRPRGASFSHGVGTAPGPNGLRNGHEKISALFNKLRTEKQFTLTSVNWYDVLMHIADTVLSGGVRRSAVIILFSFDDEGMMNAKTGDWHISNPQRARSNNSAILVRNKVSREQFAKIFAFSRQQFGEPGFVWVDDEDILTNPCLTGDTRILTENGYRQIKDLVGQSIKVITDGRVTAGDDLLLDNYSSIVQSATPVKLTQKNAPIIKIVTKMGHILRVSDNHVFPTLRGRVKAKDLVSKDKLLVLSGEGSFGEHGTFAEGFTFGIMTQSGYFFDDRTACIEIYNDRVGDSDKAKEIITKFVGKLADKEVNFVNQDTEGHKVRLTSPSLREWLKDKYGVTDIAQIKNQIHPKVFEGSREFIKGFLQALVYKEGVVFKSGHKHSPSIYLRIKSGNENFLSDVQLLIQQFGIPATIYRDRHPARQEKIAGSKKAFNISASHEINVGKYGCTLWLKKIKLLGVQHETLDGLLNSVPEAKPHNYYDTIESVSSDGTEDVYCLEQPVSASFVANGVIVGNCAEISFFAYDTTKEGWQRTPEYSGVQMCNLSTVNGKKVKTPSDFYKAVRLATIQGTLQAAYNQFDYLGQTTNNIVQREALLGVSITGIMENPDVLLNPDVLRKGAEIAKQVNAELAAKLGIRPAARICCIKPEGTTSTVLGTSAGVHPFHAKRYVRRVQVNKDSPVGQFYKNHNPHAVEESVWSANKTDWSMKFYCEIDEKALTKAKMTALQLLENVKMIQQNWVIPGANPEHCTLACNTSQKVSNTINVEMSEWADVEKFIYENRAFLSGVSVLGASGDKDYNQAPFCEVLTANQIVEKYGASSLLASGLIEDAILGFGDLWKACDHLMGNRREIVTLRELKEQIGRDYQSGTPEKWADIGLHARSADDKLLRYLEANVDMWYAKNSFIERAERFMHKHYGRKPDVKQFTYMLKDVHLLYDSINLCSNHSKVDYTNLVETKNTTAGAQEVACAGGACLV